MARKHSISADEVASTLSTIGKNALDTLTSQGCMDELATCENSHAKLLVVIRDGTEAKYKLRDDATTDQHYLFHSAWEISRLMRHQDSDDFVARCTSFFAGLQTGMYLALAGNTLGNALLRQFNATNSARRKGGQATAKLTLDDKQLARKVFSSFHNGQVSKNAAIVRTIERLANHHKITISRTALQKIVNDK